MRQVIETFTDPRDHLALDEAILFEAQPVLRLWEFDSPTVVLGRSSRHAEEVDHGYCESRSIPILRRCSGGASVVGGPGCLMYSVVLPIDEHPGLVKIDAAHRYVMSRLLGALQQQLPSATLQGICDLTIDNQKCSGNALRVTRHAVLYHGTILYDFDLGLLARCLRHAPRQPEYRAGRGHGSFVTNAAVEIDRLKADIATQFAVQGALPADQWSSTVRRFRAERYDKDHWTRRH